MKRTIFVRAVRTFVGLLVCAVFTTPAVAVEVTLSAGYEGSYSTNPDQFPSDEVEQWIHAPNVTAGITHESSSLEVDSEYNAERRIYSEETNGRFEDENLLTGRTNLTWNAVPERLIVDVDHFRTESTINSLQTAGPQNRQESQRVSAFVTYNQPIISRQHVSLSLGRTYDSFEVTANDAQTTEARLAYVVPLSDSRSVQVFAVHGETEFDDFSGADYDSKNYGVQFSSSAPAGLLNVELGYTDTEPESALRDDVSGFTGSLDFQRGVDSPFQWGFTGRREIGDRTSRLDRGILDIEADPELINSDLAEIFTTTSLAVNGIVRSGANIFTLTLENAKEDYDIAARDRSSDRITLGFERRIRENLTLISSLAYAEEDFSDADREDELTIGRVRLTWQVNPKLSVGSFVNYRERESSLSLIEYDELIGAVFVNYLFFGR